MGYRDLADRRAQRLLQARRKRVIILMGISSLLYLVAIWIYLSAGGYLNDRPLSSSPKHDDDSLAVSFGLSRQPIVRSYLVDIKSGAVPPAADPSAVLSVRFVRDLRNTESAVEFPVGQFEAGVTRIMEDKLSVTVTANPWAPERVGAGLYQGELEVRGPGIAATVPVSVWLDSRENRAWIGVVALLLGAGLGLFLKYVTERLTPQAAQLRRLHALKQMIGYGDDGMAMPSSVRVRVDELEDQISRQDHVRSEKSFESLESDKVRLVPVVALFDAIFDLLESQAKLIDGAEGLSKVDQTLLHGALDAEYRLALKIKAIPWPSGEEQITQLAEQATGTFSAGYNLMLSYTKHVGDPLLAEALRKFQQSEFDEGREIYSGWSQSTAGAVERVPNLDKSLRSAHQSAHSKGILLPNRPEPAVPFLFRHARLIAGLSSVVVVVLIGLKSQYFDDQAFSGEIATWLTLGLWGAAVELSGVSVLDVLGRLGSNGQVTASTRP